MKEPKFVDVGGTTTRYFEAGHGDPLLLIHGGAPGGVESAYDWSANFDELSARFHVYALDKLGMGYTDNPEDDAGYSMARTVEHVHQFMLAVRLDGAVVMGHSRGGLPAARIAVDHPNLVRALVVVDSNTLAAEHPLTPKDFYTKLSASAPAVPDETSIRRRLEANSYSTEHITGDFIDEMLRIAHLAKTQDARVAMRQRVSPQFRASVREVKYQTLDSIRAGLLKAPTLIVGGLNDPSAPVVLGYELFHHISLVVPQTQLHVFNQAGHYVYREHEHQFDRLVIDFAEGIGTSTALPRRTAVPLPV